jgi:putative ABC transport system permease protein
MFMYHLRHACRLLSREPAFAIAALLTLALGVGANAAVFAVVEAVLLRPLPYSEADRLMIVRHRDTRTSISKDFIAIGDFIDLAARQSAFERIAGYGGGQMTLFGLDEPLRVDGLAAGPGLLDLLRVKPILGRSLEPEDSRPGAPPVMLLGFDLWQTRFGSDPHVIGRGVRIGLRERQVVGVLPAGFHFPPELATAVVLPQTIPLQAPAERKSSWIFAVARLARERTAADAGANLATLSQQMERDFPQSNLLQSILFGTAPSDPATFAAAATILIAATMAACYLPARRAARVDPARTLGEP